MAFGWKLYGDGRTPPMGEAVAPDERLSWPRTVGIGAQHVVAMFGATFVFPIIMGLNPNLAILMSGVATVIFLLIVNGRVPSYLGTSAAFVGGVVAVRAQSGNNDAAVLGAILVSGAVLAIVGVIIHFAGARVVHAVLPPAVTGAVVMLIGFNLAPVVAGVYWPQDQWVGLLTMAFVIVCSLALRGFWARISILLGLVFGYVLSVVWDTLGGPITAPDGTGKVSTHERINFDAVGNADWFGFPHLTFPTFSFNYALLVLPAVIALIAENAGHVKAVSAMTKRNLDPVLGRAIMADGIATVVATSIGGSPTTTYAENIGVMAATRVYSTAAYYVAALVAILLGFIPKFGALVNIIPGGVLGGITVVLYGMIGLLGAKIWKENRVDFANPINLVPLAAGIIIAIGDVKLQITDNFVLSGIAFGAIVTVVGWHIARVLAPAEMKESILREGEEVVATPVMAGHEVGGSSTDYRRPDPSSVDEVTGSPEPDEGMLTR